MSVLEAKQKLFYVFLQLAKRADVDFVLAKPQNFSEETEVIHLFVLARDLVALKRVWSEQESLYQAVFWQDAVSENLEYLKPVHTVHLCLNGSTWSLPGWEDIPFHQGQFLVIHPLSLVKNSSWHSFWQNKRYAKLQKQLWQRSWQDQEGLLKEVLPPAYALRLFSNAGKAEESIDALLEEKNAYIYSETGDVLAYFDLWGNVFYQVNFTLPAFTALASSFSFLQAAETFIDFCGLWNEKRAHLALTRTMDSLGVFLPPVEADIPPVEVDIPPLEADCQTVASSQ